MKRESKNGKSRANALTTIALILVFVLGMLILLYPTVSNWWNERAATRAIFSYDEAVLALAETDYSAYLEAAQQYNEMLVTLGSAAALTSEEILDEYGYYDILDITGTGIMGYITIEKINVYLPIYHGTSSSVLSSGAGHMEGSSFPVGGESTHCVISAHRGLPSALFFTRLDELEIGDTFTVTVLDNVLTYEVDRITTVLPSEMENLYIEEGKDYCTLLTCTPYGINTHRLLVRGVRIETEETKLIYVTSEAYQIDTILVASVTAVPLFFILLIGILVGTRRRQK